MLWVLITSTCMVPTTYFVQKQEKMFIWLLLPSYLKSYVMYVYILIRIVSLNTTCIVLDKKYPDYRIQAKQMVHMKYQDLFSVKNNNNKKIKCVIYGSGFLGAFFFGKNPHLIGGLI